MVLLTIVQEITESVEGSEVTWTNFSKVTISSGRDQMSLTFHSGLG